MAETVDIEAFGYLFKDLLPDHAEELRTLESHGAIYAEFADRDDAGNFLGSFTRYRVQLRPPEIVEYVAAHRASQQFYSALKETGDFTAAVLAVEEPKFQRRVAEYGRYGRSLTIDGSTFDNRGCLASFLGPELEELVCGLRPERYAAMPELGTQANRDELIYSALKSVGVSARRLASRSNGREAFQVSNEYDVQDLAETALRAVFTDVVREEWTPKRAGGAKRIDIVIPSVGAVVECKYVRNRTHSRKVADELRIDFECYHDYVSCRQFYGLIYDAGQHIDDPELFVRDLDGLRRKGSHEFNVSIIVV